MLGFRESGFRRSSIAIADSGRDIIRRIGPNHRRTRGDRIGRIDDRWQNFIVDDNCFACGLGIGPRRRKHSGNRLTRETYNLMRQQTARRCLHRRAIGPLENRQGRNGPDIVGHQIGTRIDRCDTVHGLCGAGIDCLDPGVSVRRPQHIEPEPVLRLVVDEVSLPRNKPLILKTLDGLSRAEAQIGRQNVHG